MYTHTRAYMHSHAHALTPTIAHLGAHPRVLSLLALQLLQGLFLTGSLHKAHGLQFARQIWFACLVHSLSNGNKSIIFNFNLFQHDVSRTILYEVALISPMAPSSSDSKAIYTSLCSQLRRALPAVRQLPGRVRLIQQTATVSVFYEALEVRYYLAWTGNINLALFLVRAGRTTRRPQEVRTHA